MTRPCAGPCCCLWRWRWGLRPTWRPRMSPLGVLGLATAGCPSRWSGFWSGVAGPAWLALTDRLSLACLGIGALAGKVRSTLVAAPILKEQIGPVRIEGIDRRDRRQRTQPPRPHRRARHRRPDAGADAPICPLQLQGRAWVGAGPGCRLPRDILSPPPRPVVPGDYEFHRDAWFQQLGAVGFAIGACEPLPPCGPLPSRQPMRCSLAGRCPARAGRAFVYQAAGPEGGGMSAAMVSGDRSFITPDDAEALCLSGPGAPAVDLRRPHGAGRRHGLLLRPDHGR